MIQSKAKNKSGKPEEPELRLSMAMENYLLSIIRLGEQGVRVTLTVLAEHLKLLPQAEGLGTTLPSVGGMIRRMAREGLVKSPPNKDVLLTVLGQKFAESILRRHRLAERMVVDLLGLELQKAHEEAHRLEHAISPELENLISQKLGNPSTCPFGHPIPGNGYQRNKQEKTLDKASHNERLVIDRVPEDDPVLLKYFVDHCLIPGQIVVANEISMPRGIISLSCNDNNEVVFSYEVGTKIWVRPAPD